MQSMSVTILCLVTFALLGAYPATAAEDANDTLTKQPDTSRCEDRVCTRIYDPVCGSVDGVPMTAPSRCDLNNKIRCAKRLRTMPDLKDAHIPAIRFLHEGPCPAAVDSSTVVRLRRHAPSSDDDDDDDDDDDNDDDDDDDDDDDESEYYDSNEDS